MEGGGGSSHRSQGNGEGGIVRADVDVRVNGNDLLDPRYYMMWSVYCMCAGDGLTEDLHGNWTWPVTSFRGRIGVVLYGILVFESDSLEVKGLVEIQVGGGGKPGLE